MAHQYRFFGQKISEHEWQLDPDEVLHATKILRLSDEMIVEVMDGQGLVGEGSLKIDSKSKVRVINVREIVQTLGQVMRCVMLGALKSGDVDELIAPLVELGVDQIIVFRQEDTPAFRVSEGSHERWGRIVRTAVKQCKRPKLIQVQAVESLSDALKRVEAFQYKWMMSPEGEQDMISACESTRELKSVVTLIGGEKGLSAREDSAARECGFKAVRLGPWVLRAKTAAVASASFLGTLPRPH